MWKTEKDFSKYVMNKLKAECADCCRIETPATGVGIPDLWVQCFGDDFFIELKNIHHDLPAKFDMKDVREIIPWRPGQQAWAYRYKMYHTVAGKSKCSWTLVGMNDGMIAIRMDKLYENDCISYYDDGIMVFNKGELKSIKLSALLFKESYIKITGQ